MLFRPSVFLDTSFIIALYNTKDPRHARAIEIDRELSTNRTALVLHPGILIEIGDGFARRGRRVRGAEILRGIESDAGYTVASLDDELLNSAIELYIERGDKEWGLTDCISFRVMESLKIEAALTADEHFPQPAFRALLLERSSID